MTSIVFDVHYKPSTTSMTRSGRPPSCPFGLLEPKRSGKATAFLLAKWTLDRNGEDGSILLPPEDRKFADLLVKAAAGQDVEAVLVDLLHSRHH